MTPTANKRGGLGDPENLQPRKHSRHDHGATWNREVENVGLSLRKPLSRWKQIMNVIRMAAHHNGFECSKEAFIQLLLPITHKKIVSEPLHSRQFDMSNYRVQICTVLLTPIHNATKKEYERVKKYTTPMLIAGPS